MKPSKSTHLFVVLITIIFSGQTFAKSNEIDVFLFAGQSNMEGADTRVEDINKHPPFAGLDKPQKDVLYSYNLGRNSQSNGWTSLSYANKIFGPELSFARLIKKQSKNNIAIIKDAWGGTTLVSDWDPDGGDEKSKKLYSRFMKQINARLAELKKKGKKPVIKAMMWHQGENDMFHKKGKFEYAKNLKNFIARIRKDLNLPALKFFVGEISTKGVWGMDNRANVALICNAQKKVIAADENVFFVPTSHYSFKVGHPVGLHYHFGTLGQLQHGLGYAEAYLKAIGTPLKSKERKLNTNKMTKNKNVKLFILGGQRNMEGEEAYVEEMKKLSKYKKLLKDQKALYQYSLGGQVKSKEWESLGIIDYLGNFGPELSFGQTILKKSKIKSTLAIYKYTNSGSQSLDWLKQGSKESYRDIYKDWINGIISCQEGLSKLGYKYEIPAIIWHCSENDRALNWMANQYAKRLKSFIDDTRKDLKLANLKWIITEQPMLGSDFSNHKFYDMNKDLEALAEGDPNIKFVKTAHLPHRHVLFGTEGVLKLGETMANAWLNF